MRKHTYSLLLQVVIMMVGTSRSIYAGDDLVKAVIRGDVAATRASLNAGANPDQLLTESDIAVHLLNPTVPVRRKTPVLIVAIQQNHFDVAKVLLVS